MVNLKPKLTPMDRLREFFTTVVNSEAEVSMARTGWSCKEAAQVLDVHERRVPQALDPAVDKIARLLRADFRKTLALLLSRVHELEQADFEAELPDRIDRLHGGRVVCAEA